MPGRKHAVKEDITAAGAAGKHRTLGLMKLSAYRQLTVIAGKLVALG